MYDLLKSLIALLAMPLPLFVLGLVLASVLAWWGRRRLAAIIAGLAVTCLLLLSWAPVAERLLAPLEHAYPALEPEALTDDVAAIVVLGAGWFPDRPSSAVGRLGESATHRLLAGIHLWHQSPAAQLIMTGASRSRPDSVPIAQGYAVIARDLGIPEASLDILDWPTDTAQEAAAVRELLGPDRTVALVTSASHMPRALGYFKQAGLLPMAAPTHYLTGDVQPDQLAYWIPAARHLRKSERAIYEWLGAVAARWEG